MRQPLAFTVNLKTVRAAATLVEARLLSQEITTSQDVELLTKVLTELGHYNLAADLALTHDKSPAYALTMLVYKKNDMAEALKYLPLMSGTQCLELA